MKRCWLGGDPLDWRCRSRDNPGVGSLDLEIAEVNPFLGVASDELDRRRPYEAVGGGHGH